MSYSFASFPSLPLSSSLRRASDASLLIEIERAREFEIHLRSTKTDENGVLRTLHTEEQIEATASRGLTACRNVFNNLDTSRPARGYVSTKDMGRASDFTNGDEGESLNFEQFVAHYHDLLAEGAATPDAANQVRREGTASYFAAYLADTNTSVTDSAAIREAHTMAGATRVLLRGQWQGYSSSTPVTRLTQLQLRAHPSWQS